MHHPDPIPQPADLHRSFPIDPSQQLRPQLPTDAFDGWPTGTIRKRWTADVHGNVGVLYRFYGAGNDLLYVGITSTNAATRWNAHRRSNWWELVRTVTVEPSSVDRREAEAMEKAAIIAERPRFNVIHLRRLRLLPVRLDEGPEAVVDQFRARLLPEDFAAIVAAFHDQPLPGPAAQPPLY